MVNPHIFTMRRVLTTETCIQTLCTDLLYILSTRPQNEEARVSFLLLLLLPLLRIIFSCNFGVWSAQNASQRTKCVGNWSYPRHFSHRSNFLWFLFYLLCFLKCLSFCCFALSVKFYLQQFVWASPKSLHFDRLSCDQVSNWERNLLILLVGPSLDTKVSFIVKASNSPWQNCSNR